MEKFLMLSNFISDKFFKTLKINKFNEVCNKCV